MFVNSVLFSLTISIDVELLHVLELLLHHMNHIRHTFLFFLEIHIFCLGSLTEYFLCFLFEFC